MDEHINETPRTPVHRPRRKKSKLQLFKEAYLPLLILALAAILVITFIAGAVSRSVANHKAAAEASKAAEASIAAQQAQERDQVQQLLAEAEALAEKYDYQGALDLLATFTGDTSNYPALEAKRAAYTEAMKDLQIYSDPSVVPNLSFQMLIADPERAFNDDVYGSAYNRNYVTTDEFSKILQQLYDNQYMLVSMHDLVTVGTNEKGETVFQPKPLMLPAGMKPIVLTQTAANYYTYMTDGDDDGLPDAGGDGFPYRLNLDENGRFISEMVDAAGNKVSGAFDFVTILEDFVQKHPDFSYNGARAVLAVTGYDGVFGYRTDSGSVESMGEAYRDLEIAGAQKVVQALKNAGYELACYSYENLSYGESDYETMTADLDAWIAEVGSILGDVDIMVYPYGEDLTDALTEPYSGDRYLALQSAGFKYFVGMDSDKVSDAFVGDQYFRQIRKLVTGSNMAYDADSFATMFDAKTVLNSQRGEIPE